MNCQTLRAAIDTASRQEPIGENAQRHLTSCAACRDYAGEMSALFALLQTAPRVAAPADFDFRLRARIAAAQAQRRRPFAFLENLWSLSFSWGQTATALAAVAMVAMALSFYFVRQTPPGTTGDIARSDSTKASTRLATPNPTGTAGLNTPQVTPPVGTEIIASRGNTGPSVKAETGSRRPGYSERPALLAAPEIREAAGTQLIAGTKIMVKHARSGEMKMITVPEVTYGAQPAVARAESPAAMTQVIF
jgi:hypothetical protein